MLLRFVICGDYNEPYYQTRGFVEGDVYFFSGLFYHGKFITKPPFGMIFLDHFFQVSNSHANPSYLPENYHDNKASTMNEDVFPIENGDFPMSC